MAKPIIGDQYNFLTIINDKLIVFSKYSRKVLCRCECGTEKLIDWRYVKSSAIKSCGCKQKELAGQHSGRKEYCCKWCGTTDSAAFSYNRKTKCIKCLYQIEQKTKQNTPEVKRKRSERLNRKHQYNFNNFIYSILRRSMKKKNTGFMYEVNIDHKYLMDLIEQQDYKCALTGIKLTHIFRSLTSASLDRIDSNIGYLKGNVQFVCKGINLMKSYHTQEEAIEFINLIKK